MTPRFEDRLLRSLHGMVDTLPPAADSPRPAGGGHRRAVLTSVAVSGAAAAAAVVLGVVVVGSPGPGTSGDTAAPPERGDPVAPPGSGPSVEAPVVEDGMILLARSAGGPVQVFGDDGAPRPDIVETLRAAGIDVTVDLVPASPSLVGQIDGVGVDEGPGLVINDDWSQWTIDPAVFRGTVQLTGFRAPEPGEEIEVFGNAFAAGEPLAGVTCELEWPFTAEALAEAAATTGLTLRYATDELAFEAEGADAEDVAAAAAELETELGREVGRISAVPPAGYVGSAQASADGVVDVYVEPDPAAVPSEAEMAATGFPARDC
jgi:hypothetical protein